MTRPNGAAIEEAAVTPKPKFDDGPNVFESLEDYAVSPSEVGIGETQVVLQVKFGRPRAQEWVRCHPEPERVRYFHAIKDQKANRLFVVNPRMLSLVGSQAKLYRVRQAISTDGELYLWPAPVEGRLESDITHFNAQQAALNRWIRIEWGGKAFVAVEPQGDLGEPEWPELTFREVLEMGLAGHLINNENHPFIKRLLGRS
jgi:hypothetical protein